MHCRQVKPLLSRYCDNELPARLRQRVSNHLGQCLRCRDILQGYETCWGYVSDYRPAPWSPLLDMSFDDVLELDCLRRAFRSEGPVLFPDGTVAGRAWEFGRLDWLPWPQAKHIIESVAERAFKVVTPLLTRRDVTIVCFSPPMLRFGAGLAINLRQAGKRFHLRGARNFFDPVLERPTELRDQTVIVFVDVAHSGSLLERINRVCRQAGARDIVNLAIINQGGTQTASRLRSLFRQWPHEHISWDTFCSLASTEVLDALWYFDPEHGYSQETPPASWFDHQQRGVEHLHAFGEFWQSVVHSRRRRCQR